MERNSTIWVGWAARPVLKISAILLKYATFEVFFMFSYAKKYTFKLLFMYIAVSALKSWLILK
jgi:hypothetical protein